MGVWRTMLGGVLLREVGGDKMCGVEVEWGDLGSLSGSSAEQHVLRRQIRKWRQGGQGWDERLETAVLIGG